MAWLRQWRERLRWTLAARRRWRAMSLRIDNAECPHRAWAEGRRWLIEEAPALPLAGCRWCARPCHIEYHEDRRARPRRLIDRFGVPRHFRDADRRRLGRGRRHSDGLARLGR